MLHELLSAFTAFAVLFLLWRVRDIRDYLKARSQQQPSMFTEQLNRRLIEEHTAELKRFNQSHKKGSSS